MSTVNQDDFELAAAVRTTAKLRKGFYVVVLLIALDGQVSGAEEALGLDWYYALPAVGALELGGMVVLANADVRRRLGEHALLVRLLSAAIAGGAVVFNWLAHANHLEGGFYGGMSLLGYLVYLMNTANKRRDRLRAKGQLPPTPPAYGAAQWLRHPWLTRQARGLALADKNLDLYGSLAAARSQARADRQESAIAKAVAARVKKAAGPTLARIAVATYDMNEVAKRVARDADYDGLARLISADLTADKLAGEPAQKPAQKAAQRDDLDALVEVVTPAQPLRVEAVVGRPKRLVPAVLDGVWADFVSQHPSVYEPAQNGSREPVSEPVQESRTPRAVAAQSRPTSRRKGRLTVRVDSKVRLAQEYAALCKSLGRKPSGSELGKAAGVSRSTAKRWMSQQPGGEPS